MAVPRLVDQIRWRAYELARSGRHADCMAIERALAADGYPNVRLALQQPHVHDFIARLCEEHCRDATPDMARRSVRARMRGRRRAATGPG
jgi:hypothetical protein